MRKKPNQINKNWPAPIICPSTVEEHAAERLRELISSVRLYIDGSIEVHSVRSFATVAGVDHSSLSRIMAGENWPDLLTVTKIESCLEWT